jgi:hypothetical protein
VRRLITALAAALVLGAAGGAGVALAADPVIMAAGDIACNQLGSATPGTCSDVYTSNLAINQMSSPEGLAALLAIGATTASCRATVEVARAGGATDQEIVGVLLAVAPAVGGARVVGAAPRLALAIDYDVEDVDEIYDGT